MELVAKLRGRPPLLTRIAVEVLCRRTTFSPAKIQRETGWSAQVPLDEGFARCAAWLREVGEA
jgi:nucleoside-diphosphate-sugar epimerase